MSRWVVREGREKGKGRYMGRGSGEDWREFRADAHAMYVHNNAIAYAAQYGGRVVKLVPKRKAVRVTRAQVEAAARAMFVNEGGAVWPSYSSKDIYLSNAKVALRAAGFEVDE